MMRGTLCVVVLMGLSVVTSAKKCEDSKDCSAILPGLLSLAGGIDGACDREVLGAKVFQLCPKSCKRCSNDGVVERTRTKPTLISERGNLKMSLPNGGSVIIDSEAGTKNLSDTMTHAEADVEFDKTMTEVSSVSRRAAKTECNVGELLEQLITTNEEEITAAANRSEHDSAAADVRSAAADARSERLIDAIDSFNENYVNLTKELTKKTASATVEGSTTTFTGGAAWDPIVDTPVLSDLGGAAVTVTFPPSRELVSHPDIKVYRCLFSEIDAKGKVTGVKRLSALTAAAAARGLKCISPAWGQGGSAPTKAEWKTTLTILEGGRAMPSPNPEIVFTWMPNRPALKNGPKGDQLKIDGRPSVRKFYEFPVDIDYPYGPKGYSDLSFTLKTDRTGEVTDMATTGTTTGSTRSIKFGVTAKVDFDFTITVTVASKLTKLASEYKYKFNWEKFVGLGEGGTSDKWMSPETIDAIHKRTGTTNGGKNWVMCYSRKVHGNSASTLHGRCDNKGPLLIAMRRGNGRVFGGYIHRSIGGGSGYDYSGLLGNAGPWLFRTDPSNSKKTDFMNQQNTHGSYQYYRNSGYHYTWGGGHDLTCYNSMTYCYANIGHNYYSVHGYHTTQSNKYLTGDYQWNHASENGDYEVYIVKK